MNINNQRLASRLLGRRAVDAQNCGATAKVVGARSAEITRMASAFEHDDLKRALAL